MRLDSYLAENGYAKSRTFAKTLIDGGFVNVNGKKANKASLDILDGDTVEVTGKPYEYVSRGGLKLEAALDAFGVDPSGKVCVDIGASSGGFTDCLLRRGAVRVFAVDSGSDQLDASLRADGRVVLMENFNARYLTAEQIPQPLDFFSVDVSFISLNLILPAVRPLMADGGEGVCLVKPQFEAGKEKVGKKGVVRDPQVHLEVLEQFLVHAANAGFGVKDITFSPIKGPEGNIEYLGYLTTREVPPYTGDLAALVEQSHSAWKEAEG